MKKLFLFLIFAASLFCAPAWGTTVYVSQSGGSVYCGADGTLSTTALGSVSWAAGNTYKMCGTVTSPITPTASGTSGNPITIFYETGAKSSSPVFPVTGGLNLAGLSWIVVDGGVSCGPSVTNKATCNGTIQNTANGTGLANHTDQTIGINVDGSSNVTIQNMLVGPIYLRTSSSDLNVPGQPLPSAVWANGATNLTILNSSFHDANWSQSFVSGTASSGLTWTNDDIYNSDHCWAIGVVAQTTTNIQVNGNRCHDGANWDSGSADYYHHDGLHLYGTGGGGKITNVRTYNNTFDGNWGVNNTAAIFEEGPSGGEVDNTVYNNLFLQDSANFNWNNGFINLGNLNGSNPSVNNFYNNTLIADSNQGAYMAQLAYAGTVENNVFVTSNTAAGATLWLIGHTGTVDYNTYATPESTSWSTNGSTQITFAAWKAAGNDAHAPAGTPGTAPFNLSATTGVPSSGFIGIGAGVNLTSLSIAALDSDMAGSSRPSSGAWTIGALNPAGTSYTMLNWMLMSPSLAATEHFAGTDLDGTTPSNHLYTQLDTSNFYWVKGDGGYPWDIELYDSSYIYLSTTEYSYALATAGKRFESLNPTIGLKGVPFAKTSMNIGDSVLSTDTRLAIYTACGTATYTNLGTAKTTLTGPYVETIGGAGANLPVNLTTIHLEYEWGLNGSYAHQSGSTKETYTFAQPYGLVHWQTQTWNTGTGSYGAPTAATNYDILTAGVAGLPAYDPCGFDTTTPWSGASPFVIANAKP
jgi:hypothetical protein